MRKVVVLFLILLLPAICSAVSVEFSWDANTESDLAGYRLYQSQSSGVYGDIPVAVISAGIETVTIDVTSDGTYFFVLTAYDTSDNESGYSNEVVVTIDTAPPDPPTGLDALIKKIIAWLKNYFSRVM